MILFLIIVIVILIIICISINSNTNQFKNTINALNHNLADVEEKNKNLTNINNHLTTTNNYLTAANDYLSSVNQQLVDQNSNCQNELVNYQNQLTDAVKTTGDLNLIDERQNELKRLAAQIEELTNLSVEKTAKLQDLEAQSEKLLKEINDLAEKRDISAADVKELEGSVSKIVGLLNQCAENYKEALIRSSDAEKSCIGKVIQLNEKEQKLIALIKELKDNYAELADDFATIEWKKIWLPKAKSLVSISNADGLCGIYKLTLIKDTSVCYIGQAVDIKERWYQHMKKMIGADKKGNEKLYNSGLNPSDFGWEVVESWDGVIGDRNKWLDEREAYWIKFYATVEVGLNSKKGNQ